MNISYIRSGDYFIPDLKLEEENRPIGKWGRMHRDYLKEHHPIRFNNLLLSGDLWAYLADLNEQAQQRMEVLVGRDGEFDQIVSTTICRCKREYRSDNSAHIWVLPYFTAEFRDNEESFRDYYDEIEVCEASAGSHYKNAHQTRNRAMVSRSDMVVFCIQRARGGAWQTMKYTREQGVPCINLNASK